MLTIIAMTAVQTIEKIIKILDKMAYYTDDLIKAEPCERVTEVSYAKLVHNTSMYMKETVDAVGNCVSRHMVNNTA